MLTELLQGQTNVFRFPTERRAPATLDLLYNLLPDVRDVMNVAEAFDLGLPGIELRDAVDAETAEYILNSVTTERGERRRQVLDDLLNPLLTDAVGACRLAQDKSAAANEIQLRLTQATKRGDWTGSLEEHALIAAIAAAEALVAAHVKAEEAQGVARAVGLAKRGEMWIPRSAEAELAWLDEAHTA